MRQDEQTNLKQSDITRMVTVVGGADMHLVRSGVGQISSNLLAFNISLHRSRQNYNPVCPEMIS